MAERFNSVSNIVVVGAWNKAIFNPEWVRQNLFSPETNLNIELAMNPTPSFLFKTDNFSMYVVNDRLCFNLLRDDDAARCEIIEAFRVICRLLLQTPVSAIGFNFLFDEETDYGFIDSGNSYSRLVESTSQRILNEASSRVFLVSEKETLTLKVTKSSPLITFDFNYNISLSSIRDILDLIGDEDNILVNKHIQALQLMDAIHAM